MTTHVFIVDSTTFKYHLEYLFAGTGAKDHKIDFNDKIGTVLHATTENMLVSMIADGCRIRRGDQIIFYLQQDFSEKIYEGKFFGIFKAKHDWAFLDNNDKRQFLKDKLGKSLTFRTLIEPHEVYAGGVTEWEALDEIQNMTSPAQMLWSLIYRKLKGNRGNTMITTYEAERLVLLIRNKNNRKELNCANKTISFDPIDQKIVCLNEKSRSYKGRQDDINLMPRLLEKYQAGHSFEAHLQAYITKSLGKGINKSLDKAILNGASIEWLGNEVSCGVGMQRIDVMPSVIKGGHRVLTPIELKAVEASERNVLQIQRYVDWIEQYYLPNRPSDIQPILLAKKTADKTSENYKKLVESFSWFNHKNGEHCANLEFIEFEQERDGLIFNIVEY
ncbi:DUF91 domain-containing protein [Patescibacteria group bacterium]|nr:DUF91 domain-containing protein [Patescibacteria group bacterium]